MDNNAGEVTLRVCVNAHPVGWPGAHIADSGEITRRTGVYLVIRIHSGFGEGRIDVLSLCGDGNESLVYSFKTSCVHDGTLELKSAIHASSEPGITKTIFDFRHVKHCSSGSLVKLVSLWHELQAGRIEVAIANVSQGLAYVFKALALDQAFKICGSMEEAIATLSSRE